MSGASPNTHAGYCIIYQFILAVKYFRKFRVSLLRCENFVKVSPYHTFICVHVRGSFVKIFLCERNFGAFSRKYFTAKINRYIYIPYKTIYWRGINIGDWRFFRKFANIKSANINSPPIRTRLLNYTPMPFFYVRVGGMGVARSGY